MDVTVSKTAGKIIPIIKTNKDILELESSSLSSWEVLKV